MLEAFATPLVRVYASIFVEVIQPGYANPFELDARYMAIARIGNYVMNEAAGKRAAHRRRISEGLGG